MAERVGAGDQSSGGPVEELVYNVPPEPNERPADPFGFQGFAGALRRGEAPGVPAETPWTPEGFEGVASGTVTIGEPEASRRVSLAPAASQPVEESVGSQVPPAQPAPWGAPVWPPVQEASAQESSATPEQPVAPEAPRGPFREAPEDVKVAGSPLRRPDETLVTEAAGAEAGLSVPAGSPEEVRQTRPPLVATAPRRASEPQPASEPEAPTLLGAYKDPEGVVTRGSGESADEFLQRTVDRYGASSQEANLALTEVSGEIAARRSEESTEEYLRRIADRFGANSHEANVALANVSGEIDTEGWSAFSGRANEETDYAEKLRQINPDDMDNMSNREFLTFADGIDRMFDEHPVLEKQPEIAELKARVADERQAIEAIAARERELVEGMQAPEIAKLAAEEPERFDDMLAMLPDLAEDLQSERDRGQLINFKDKYADSVSAAEIATQLTTDEYDRIEELDPRFADQLADRFIDGLATLDDVALEEVARTNPEMVRNVSWMLEAAAVRNPQLAGLKDRVHDAEEAAQREESVGATKEQPEEGDSSTDSSSGGDLDGEAARRSATADDEAIDALYKDFKPDPDAEKPWFREPNDQNNAAEPEESGDWQEYWLEPWVEGSNASGNMDGRAQPGHEAQESQGGVEFWEELPEGSIEEQQPEPERAKQSRWQRLRAALGGAALVAIVGGLGFAGGAAHNAAEDRAPDSVTIEYAGSSAPVVKPSVVAKAQPPVGPEQTNADQQPVLRPVGPNAVKDRQAQQETAGDNKEGETPPTIQVTFKKGGGIEDALQASYGLTDAQAADAYRILWPQLQRAVRNGDSRFYQQAGDIRLNDRFSGEDAARILRFNPAESAALQAWLNERRLLEEENKS